MKDIDLGGVYLAYFEAINEHQFHRMTEFVHDTIVCNDEAVARDHYVTAMQQAADSVKNSVRRLEDLIVEGDRVAVRLTGSGTPVQEWLGRQVTGRDVTFTEYAFYHFRDGRIERVWSLVDTHAVTRQPAARILIRRTGTASRSRNARR